MRKVEILAMHALRALLGIVLLGGISTAAQAQLAFELRTGNNATLTQRLTVDSNRCPSEGPTAAYVGGVITNTAGAAIQNVTATLGGLNSNVYLAGGQPASQFIGTLGAGQSIAVYWFTGFGCTAGAGATPTISLVSSAGTQNIGLTLTIQTAISANAGGNVTGSLLGPGAVVGQTIYFDADYDFGGADVGDEFWLQPAGGQNFNAACFRLVGTRITRSNVDAAVVGASNVLKLVQPTKQPGNGYFISVRYFFEYQCAGASTSARPYAVQTSGTKIKYTGNYDGTGSVSIQFPGAANPFTVTKSVNETSGFAGGSNNLVYTVTVSNPSPYDAIMGQITDVLPAGMSFVALESDSEVTLANSSSVPASGATGTLQFVGRRGQSYALAAGGSVTLKYSVTRPATAGQFVNSAQGVFGSATTPVASVTYTSTMPLPLSITKVSSVHSDPVNGTAGAYAIPGSVVEYVIQVGNPNVLPIDQDSVIVTDNVPAETAMCLTSLGGGVPVTFADGPSASGLAMPYTALSDLTDAVEFSSDNGVSWAHSPVADAQGCDASITDFRVNLDGAFAAGGQFTLRARFTVR